MPRKDLRKRPLPALYVRSGVPDAARATHAALQHRPPRPSRQCRLDCLTVHIQPSLRLRVRMQAGAVRKIQVALLALTITTAAATAQAAIDNAALSNEQDGSDWPAYGRTFSEGHFSPLSQINASTVTRLGLAWSLDLDSPMATCTRIPPARARISGHSSVASPSREYRSPTALETSSTSPSPQVLWGVRRPLSGRSPRAGAGTRAPIRDDC